MALLGASALMAQQGPPASAAPLMVTSVTGLTSATIRDCSPAISVIDNRSTISRVNTYHSFAISGSGTWTVAMNYSDSSCTGPWTSFGASSEITNGSPLPWIGYGNGYHAYIQFVITGNAVVNYGGTKALYFSPVTGSASGFTWTGPWSGMSSYVPNDVVSYNGSSWIALQASTNVTPGSNGAIWQIVAQGAQALPSGGQTQLLQIEPNVSGPVYRFTSLPFVDPDDFNFPAQTFSAALTANVQATVTLTPCPLGVNGAQQFLPVRISGTGTPETINFDTTGAGPGSCTSGAPTGTVVFTPKFSHSTGWALNSATDGIQEALFISPNVNIPPGNYPLYASISPTSTSTLHCNGGHGTGGDSQVILEYQQPTGAAIQIFNDAVTVEGGCTLQQVGTPSGSVGLQIYGQGSANPFHSGNTTRVYDMTIAGFGTGFDCDGGGGSNDVERLQVNSSVGDNIVTGACQGWWKTIISEFAGANGLHSSPASGAGGGFATWISGYQSFGNQGWGIYAPNGPIYLDGQRSYLNSDKLGGIYINYPSLNHLSNVDIEYEGLAYAGAPWATNPTAPGLEIDSGGDNVQASNIAFFSIQGNCMLVAGSQNIFDGVGIQGCNAGGNLGLAGYGVRFVGPGATNTLTDAQFYSGTIQANQQLLTLGNVLVSTNDPNNAGVRLDGGSVIANGVVSINPGAGGAFLCGNASVTDTTWVFGGTVNIGSCAQSASIFHIVPTGLAVYTRATEPTVVGVPSIAYIRDGAAGAPCVSGSGSLAWWNGSIWVCPGAGGGAGASNYQTAKGNNTNFPTEPAFNFVNTPTVTWTLTDTAGVSTNIMATSTAAGTVTSSGSPTLGNLAAFTGATNITPATSANFFAMFSACGAPAVFPSLGGTCLSAYQIIQTAMTSQTVRSKLNFIGSGGTTITAVDNPTNGSTDLTISSTGTGSSLPGQTGTDFGITLSMSTGGVANDTLTVATGNWLFGNNNFTGTNTCNFTLTGGTGTGIGDVSLSRAGVVTLQYSNTGGQTVSITGSSSVNCIATGAAAPQFPDDGSKDIGTVPIAGTKTWGPLVASSQFAFGGGYYFTTCTLPAVCTVAGDTVNVSMSSSVVQNNIANAMTSAGSLDAAIAAKMRTTPVFSTYAAANAALACSGSTVGYEAVVQDSNTNTWGAAVAGGGGDTVKMFCDGTSWTVSAK